MNRQSILSTILAILFFQSGYIYPARTRSTSKKSATKESLKSIPPSKRKNTLPKKDNGVHIPLTELISIATIADGIKSNLSEKSIKERISQEVIRLDKRKEYMATRKSPKLIQKKAAPVALEESFLKQFEDFRMGQNLKLARPSIFKQLQPRPQQYQVVVAAE